MSVNIWILKLRAATFLRLARKHKRTGITGITYIEASRGAKFLLKVLTKLKKTPAPIYTIEAHHSPSGPRLDLASVRNDKGEVIVIDIFHHVLRVREHILETMLAGFKDFTFLKQEKALNMPAAYLGLRIAEDISEAVFIANYARWKDHGANQKESPKNVLVIPKTEWAEPLAADLRELVDEVVIDKREWKRALKRLALILKRSLVSTLKTGFAPWFRSTAEQDINGEASYSHKGGKIMATYAMGIFDGKRNDISYFHASKMTPDRMVFYFKYNDLVPSEEELQWLRENNITCFAGAGMSASIPGIPQWQPSPGYRKFLKEFYRMYIKTLRQCISKRPEFSLWLLDNYWHMGLQSAYWKDFFAANNISIAVHQVPAANNFIPNLALSETGGIACIMERSILFDYCTYIHNSPNHINFVTGSYSLTQIPEASFSSVTVQTGALNVGDSIVPIDGFDRLRSHVEIIIAIFDEMPNPWFFGDSVEEMYRAMIDLADSDDRFGLLVKTKKPQVLERLGTVEDELRRLQAEGKCLVADWKVTAANAAAHSDMVVLVPSTVAFESVLTGKRTILFNPMRSGSKLFYTNNGLNRRVFEDAESMKQALTRFVDRKDNSVGDCGDLVSQIDPYNDRRGAERMGDYLKWCLEGFDTGLDREQAIKEANKRYVQAWNIDKITSDNAYPAPHNPN